jgi:hypothetical protein
VGVETVCAPELRFTPLGSLRGPPYNRRTP